MIMTPLLQQLVQSLRCMPGIGPKSAQRIAFHLLRHRDDARILADSLHEAMDKIAYCASCRTFSETDLCVFCASDRRDKSIMCIVESPADQYAIEQTAYRGMYFVLHGRLSPLDGIGPDEIGMTHLRERLSAELELREIIIATNPTLEGEATAYYIAQLAKQSQIACTRIAHGVPLGGELESIDTGTLTHAFAGRGIIAG
ncbi:MAG: recombination mediator RecR [Gammaproteobacteria bacterium]|nr:recombination mediator RecR [Gammaproteobacteria bacterium]